MGQTGQTIQYGVDLTRYLVEFVVVLLSCLFRLVHYNAVVVLLMLYVPFEKLFERQGY